MTSWPKDERIRLHRTETVFDECALSARHQYLHLHCQDNPPAVRKRFALHTSAELAMSVITLGELRFGAEKSQSRKRTLAIVQQLKKLIPVYPLPETAAEHYGQIRVVLQQSGQPIGNNDLWLAAHALAQNWTIVSNNEREFVRVPSLDVENWVNQE